MDIWKELRDEGVDSGLLDEVRRFREAHPLTPEAQERVPVPKYLYYGREVWESAAAALLCGEHLLLAGPKATGKNVLAEDLAALFGRPVWDVSMYVNVDAAALIGADTLKDGRRTRRWLCCTPRWTTGASSMCRGMSAYSWTTRRGSSAP